MSGDVKLRQESGTRWVFLSSLVIISALALVLLLWAFNIAQDHDMQLKDKETSAGIVGLELAFSAERAAALLAQWKESKLDEASRFIHAEKGLVQDRWLIFGYVVFGSALILLLLTVLRVPLDRFWILLAAMPLAAGLADLVENLFLGRILAVATPQTALVIAAGLCALVKFILLGLAVVAGAAIIGFGLFHRATRKPPQYSKHLVPLSEVIRREGIYIRSRRRKAEVPATEDPAPVGMALSGGGIRSATLSLGALQSLAGSGFFKRLDYLSTVSGGGYIGSALSSLLSCKALDKYLGPDAPNQFEFDAEDEAHFDVKKPADSPFYDDQRTPLTQHRQWLSGRMVMEHLRAFGDYLVRKHRTFDRDVLRAFGTLLTGICCTLGLFFNVVMIGAALALLALALCGSKPFPEPSGGYAGTLLTGAGGPVGLLWAAGIGGLFAIGAGVVCGACADRAPKSWFERGGDTYEDARQRRALWVLASLTLPAAFAAPAALRSFVPQMQDAMLVPVCFFVGGFFALVLAYILLVCVIPGKRERRSNRNSRSYLSSIIGLFFYLFLAAVCLGLVSALLGAAIAKGQSLPRPEALAGGGGAGLVGALVLGLMSWWRNSKQENIQKNEERLKGIFSWLKTSSEFIQKLVLGAAAGLVLTAGLMLCMVLVEQLLRWIGPADPGTIHYLIFSAAAGLLLIAGCLVDFNKISMHYFYRDRLAEAYLSTLARALGTLPHGSPEIRREHSQMRLLDLHGRPGKGARATARKKAMASTKAPGGAPSGSSFVQYRLQSRALERVQIWKALEPEPEPFAGAVTAAPYHLYNACLNLSTDRDATYRSRKSDIFIFSKLFCGAPAIGFVDTGVYRSGATKVARVMTISGAAINSALGRQTFFAQAFGATLFNVRLGQWMENPGYRGGKHLGRRETVVFWPKYLLMEVLGMSDSRRRLVHLSDGGHTGDNLGLISLLQRRCRLILVVDAECDTDWSFGSLMNAVQYAEADMGIRFEFRLDDLKPDKRGFAAKHYALGTILYPETDSEPSAQGHLVILKSSVHKDDDETVRKYRQTHPAFPQEPTSDQFFSEEQFEAYRKLGQNMADQLLKEHAELGQGRIALT